MVPTSAFGQEDPADAFYLQAVQLFNEGRYREALDYFNRAIELRADPIFYCNRAAVELQLKATRDALNSLRECRDLYEGDKSEVVEIDAEIGALEMTVDVVTPGAAAVAEAIANIGSGTGVVGPPPQVVDREANELLLWSAYTTGGVAVVALGAALVVEITTRSVIDDFEEEANRGTNRARYDELRASIETRKTVLVGLTTLGAVALASSGVLLWLYSEETETGRGRVSAAVAPLPGGVGLTVGGTY